MQEDCITNFPPRDVLRTVSRSLINQRTAPKANPDEYPHQALEGVRFGEMGARKLTYTRRFDRPVWRRQIGKFTGSSASILDDGGDVKGLAACTPATDW